eukprot:786264-Ditylum_brightwellii.AAC.1
MGHKYYKHLVFTKHHIGRIYCHESEVMRVLMKTWKNNDWKEKEEKEMNDFLVVEKDIYLQYFPHNKAMLDEENDDNLPKENIAVGKQGKTTEKSDESSVEMITSGSDSDNSDGKSHEESSENESNSSSESD